MIFDKSLLFSDAQAITATAASTNVIDLRAMGTVYGAAAALPRDFAKATEIPLLIQVVEDFNTLTSLKIDIELDSTETFTPDKTITLGTFALATLKAGFQVPWKLFPAGIDLRFMRLKYTVTGTDPTTGKITAGIVAAVQTNGVTG